MQNHDKNSVLLFFVFYVLHFKMNLLFNKRICEKKFQKSFN